MFLYLAPHIGHDLFIQYINCRVLLLMNWTSHFCVYEYASHFFYRLSVFLLFSFIICSQHTRAHLCLYAHPLVLTMACPFVYKTCTQIHINTNKSSLIPLFGCVSFYPMEPTGAILFYLLYCIVMCYPEAILVTSHHATLRHSEEEHLVHFLQKIQCYRPL